MFNRLLLFSLLFIFNACANYMGTKVHVNIMKPAEISLGEIKNIAVLDFDFVGEWTFDEKDEPETLAEIIKEGLKQSLDIPENSVEKLDPNKAFPGKEISEKIITSLVKNGHYSVVDRSMLDKILNEQKLSMSGIVIDDNVTKIGEMLGVDAFLIGNGNYSVKDDGGWYKKESNEKVYYYYKINRKIDVSITYKIVSVETGQVIASKENSSRNYDDKDITRALFNNQYFDYVQAQDEKTAREKIPEWKPIVNKLIDKIVKNSIKQIAPYYKKTSKLIKSGYSIGMKTGLQYAKRNMWEDAKDSWEQVLKDHTPNGIKDRIPAMYNLGVYCEIKDDLDDAEEIFDKCFKESGKNEYLDARQRVQKRRKELEKLEKQITN